VDRELAPAPAASAHGRDAAAMAVDYAAHQGEADTQARVRVPGTLIRLDEEIEHTRQDILIDADTVVANADDRFAVFPCHR